MNRRQIRPVENSQEVTNPDVTSTTVSDVDSQPEAEILGDEYLPFVDAAYTGAGGGDAQQQLERHITGWHHQDGISTPENQVFYHDSDSDVVIVAPGTRNVQDAARTWREISSEEQAMAAQGAAVYFPGIARAVNTGADIINAFSSTMGPEERIDAMHGMIDLVREERGADANILLMGHSLGGYVARKTAHETGLSSLIYNSAVGRGYAHKNNTSKNVEVRIKHDVVSLTSYEKRREFMVDRGFQDPLSAHMTERFSLDPELYKKVRSGEVRLRRPGEPHYQEPFKPFSDKPRHDPSVTRDFVDRSCPRGYRRVKGTCTRF